jgi:hypothetical protein
MPLATPLIEGASSTVISKDDQWQLAAWAFKMAMLVDVANPDVPEQFFSAAERKQFHQTTLPNEHVRVFLANYKYGRHPTHAKTPSHVLTERDGNKKSFKLKISTITAGCLAMQVMSVRSVTSGELEYASEIAFEFLGRAREAVVPIWPPSSDAVRWPPSATMDQADIEDWTDMWAKAQGVTPRPESDTQHST